MAVGSAYLGGHLVYGERIGVDHSAEPKPENGFKTVLPDASLGEDQMRAVDLPVDLDVARVLLARQNGKLYALGETCSHLGGPLSEGTLEDGARALSLALLLFLA